MKTEQEIADILLQELSHVYCNNCNSNGLSDKDDDYNCEDCYRKRMGWSLSNITAKRLAKQILK